MSATMVKIVSQKDMDAFVGMAYGDECTVPSLEGWTDFDIDTDEGEFDSEKGAMYCYLLSMVSPEGDLYQAYDGYYTGVTGHVFHDNVAFYKVVPQKSFMERIQELGLSDVPVDVIIKIYKEIHES